MEDILLFEPKERSSWHSVLEDRYYIFLKGEWKEVESPEEIVLERHISILLETYPTIFQEETLRQLLKS